MGFVAHKQFNNPKQEYMNRIPRPAGTTQAAMNWREDQSIKNIKRLRRITIKAFISHNLFMLHNQATNIRVEDKASHKKQKKKSNKKEYIELSIDTLERANFNYLCLVLGLSTSKVEGLIDQVLMKDTSKMATDHGQLELQAMTRAVSKRLFFDGLGKVPEMFDWAEELKGVTRIKGYSPGHIIATNSAITNALNHANKMIDTAMKLGALGEPKRPQSLTQNNLHLGTLNPNPNSGDPNNPTQGSQFLTPTMALRLLEEKGLTKVPLDETALAIKYGIFSEDIPDVKALPTDAQGANNFNIADIVTTNNHEDRREREEGISEVVLEIESKFV